ncbi:unnamed protein product [Ranitomeya imitator]|uniref:Uncharacterized protein n=1 Tax=Ranitomeya imitator TaxID=111125 RepID=A0ABN9L219_9NEOB|nr:unnamed protein product [Ranitomeya imitator]
MMTSHLFTSYNKHISLHKDFPEVLLDDSRSPANTRTSVLVSAPSLHLAVRFPIPDLRSDQERGPWFKKSLQKEVLHLNFSDAEFKTEVLGGCSPEQLKLEFTFKELAGAFQEESDGPQTLFIRVVKKSDEVDGDMTTSDNFDWPRSVLIMCCNRKNTDVALLILYYTPELHSLFCWCSHSVHTLLILY